MPLSWPKRLGCQTRLDFGQDWPRLRGNAGHDDGVVCTIARESQRVPEVSVAVARFPLCAWNSGRRKLLIMGDHEVRVWCLAGIQDRRSRFMTALLRSKLSMPSDGLTPMR
jgi:hypothetical protein